jgi:hypothetical protein
MKRLLIAMAVLACAAIAQGQGVPPGKWWQHPQIVRELQLSAEQRNHLDDIFRTNANGLIDAKAEVEKLQVAIRGELDRPQLRRPELQRIATQLSAARGKLFERELMMLADMRSVLTEVQWTKARQHLDRMQDRPGGQRPPPRGRRP